MTVRIKEHDDFDGMTIEYRTDAGSKFFRLYINEAWYEGTGSRSGFAGDEFGPGIELEVNRNKFNTTNGGTSLVGFLDPREHSVKIYQRDTIFSSRRSDTPDVGDRHMKMKVEIGEDDFNKIFRAVQEKYMGGKDRYGNDL